LGSIQLLTDEQGKLIEEYSYDAWGMRRDPYTFDPILSGSSQIAYGFTGHEQLDLFKLVNMNGRMYDPVIGRFMSPDPVLQFPNFTQGLNPYSYVLNNPLRYTDPSGYSLVGQLAAIGASIAFSGGNPFAAAAIYASIMTVDYIIERKFKINIGQIFEYYTQTFVVTTIQTGGSLVIGGIIGNVDKLGREILRATAHGAFNGTMRMAQGGRFEHGFLSGFVSSLGGSAMQSYGTSMSTADKIVLSSVIGGTAEALGGGKFANGAVTGAFVEMYNHLHGEKARKELQNKLQQAIQEQHSYYNNIDPFEVSVRNPFAIDFSLQDFTPTGSMLRNNFEDVAIEIIVDGKQLLLEVDVHMRTASNPNNKRYNWGVKIIPANSGIASDGFALPSGYNAAIYNNVENRNFSGSPIVIINFSEQTDYLNFMHYVSE